MGRLRPREGEPLAQGHTAQWGLDTGGLMFEPASWFLPLTSFHTIPVMVVYFIIEQFSTISYLCVFTYFVVLRLCITYTVFIVLI